MFHPGQLCPYSLLEGLFPEPEEGTLVSGAELFLPEALLSHGQTEVAKCAGAAIEQVDLAPLVAKETA